VSRLGACLEHNAAMDSFFSSLKTERTEAKTYRSRDEAKADMFDYIAGIDAKRRYSTIGSLSPMNRPGRVRLTPRHATAGAGQRAPATAWMFLVCPLHSVRKN